MNRYELRDWVVNLLIMGSIERVMEEDDSEGPPPGFNCIMEQQQDDDDDLPPGFSTPPPPPSLDACMEAEENAIDEEKPPSDRYSRCTPEPPTSPKTPLVTTISSDINQKSNQDDIEDEDDGPPPGWNLIPPQQCKPSKPSPSSPLSAIPADIEMDSRRNDTSNESNILPCEPEPPLGQNSSPSTSLSKPPHSADTSETGIHRSGHNFVENNGHQSKRQAVSPSQKPASIQVPTSAHITHLGSEKGQLVCGTCRQLLSYPRGAKYVKCSKCQEVNLVLEEHEVGQVKCGGCLVLLMYPYGSPAVRCSSCRFVTSIGNHNRRPPLSEQQARAHRHPRTAGVR